MTIAPGPRILSIRQPFAWAILAGRKKVENRTWNTEYRGTVYLHAGKAFDREGLEWITEELGLRVPKDLPMGAIVGVCTLRDVLTRDPKHVYGDWFGGPYGFVLSRPRALARPIPLLGNLGLYTAPPGIVRRVERQLGSAL